MCSGNRRPVRLLINSRSEAQQWMAQDDPPPQFTCLPVQRSTRGGAAVLGLVELTLKRFQVRRKLRSWRTSIRRNRASFGPTPDAALPARNSRDPAGHSGPPARGPPGPVARPSAWIASRTSARIAIGKLREIARLPVPLPDAEGFLKVPLVEPLLLREELGRQPPKGLAVGDRFDLSLRKGSVVDPERGRHDRRGASEGRPTTPATGLARPDPGRLRCHAARNPAGRPGRPP